MTPITWQAAVDDEEQRPLLQDILEAAVDDRRQAAVDVEEQWPQLQDIFEAAMLPLHHPKTELKAQHRALYVSSWWTLGHAVSLTFEPKH